MRIKYAIKNVSMSFILQAVTLICGFIIPKLILSNYGSNVNGLVTSITKFLAYISLLELGFGPVVKSVLYKPIAKKNRDEIEKILKASDKFFKRLAYIFIIYIILLCFVLPVITAKEFSIEFTMPLVIIIGISTFAEYFFGMTYKLYLQAEQKTYVISVIQISTLVLNTITTIVLIKMGASIHIVKLVTAMIFVARPIFQNVYVKKKYNINLRNVEDDYKINQKWDGMAQHFAYVIHSNADIVILTLCSTMAEVSVYYVYLLITASIKSILQSFSNGIDATFGDIIARDEIEKLNKSFRAYEILFYTVVTILFSATAILIVPFVKVYTAGIHDANYIRPVFAYIMVISEFIWAIREPYNMLIKVAGHFKQTKMGAWIEAIVNVVISIALVWKYGLVGIAIGTLVAMTIRGIEFMYYTSKHIFKRSLKYNFKYVFIIVIESLVILALNHLLPKIEVISYLSWIKIAIPVTIISIIVVVGINLIAYKNEVSEIKRLIYARLKIKK